MTAILALSHLDPTLAVYAWFTGAATSGLIALMALVSLAIVLYFRRTRTATMWYGSAAPALACASLAALFAVVLVNYRMLVGGASSRQ